jgi:2-keto-3-deoxy-L-rhamnonate aldolase RhmA
MRENKAKQKLAAGEPVFQCMTLSCAPSVVEVLGRAGFDIICLDGEHGSLDRQTLENLVRAAECVNVTPIIRTTLSYAAEILPFLDTGVMGIMRPHCKTAAEAKMLVDAVRYAPQGTRGMTPGRANDYAVSGVPAKEYIAASNRETIVMPQIEDVEGIKNLPEILKVEGIDVLAIGDGDLSNSMGYPGQRTHPEVVEAIDHIIDLAHRAGIPTFNPGKNAEMQKRWFDKGALVFYEGDLRLLFDGTVARLQALRTSVQ